MYSGPLSTTKMKFFVTIVNSTAKSSTFDMAGVSGYSERSHPPLVTAKIYFPGDRKPLTSELLLMKKKAQGNRSCSKLQLKEHTNSSCTHTKTLKPDVQLPYLTSASIYNLKQLFWNHPSIILADLINICPLTTAGILNVPYF